MIAPGILFHLPVGDSNFDSTHKANQLADFYLGGTKNIVPENFDKITDMFTDAFVTYAVECFAKHAQTTQKVFHYKVSGWLTDATLTMLQEKVISITTFEGNLMMTIEVWQTILANKMVTY